MKIDMAFVEGLSGYRRGRPPRPTGGLSVDGGSIDAEVCADSTCENCRHKGMEYHPFVKDEPRSYRAFAVCPECGEVFEF